MKVDKVIQEENYLLLYSYNREDNCKDNYYIMREGNEDFFRHEYFNEIVQGIYKIEEVKSVTRIKLAHITYRVHGYTEYYTAYYFTFKDEEDLLELGISLL